RSRARRRPQVGSTHGARVYHARPGAGDDGAGYDRAGFRHAAGAAGEAVGHRVDAGERAGDRRLELSQQNQRVETVTYKGDRMKLFRIAVIGALALLVAPIGAVVAADYPS